MTFPTFEQVQFTPAASAAGFPKTQTITACEYDRDTLVTTLDHPETWPCVVGPFDPQNMVYANQWLIIQQPDGTWLAGISEYLRGSNTPPYRQGSKLMEQPIAGDPNSPAGTPEGSQFYDRGRWGALCDWRPKDGQVIGVFVTTQVRGGVLSPIKERSNMVFLALQVEDGLIRSTTVAGEEGGTAPGPDPTELYVGVYGSALSPVSVHPSSAAGKSVLYNAAGMVLSMQPGGVVDYRPEGTDGPWEQATLTDGAAVYVVNGSVYALQAVAL